MAIVMAFGIVACGKDDATDDSPVTPPSEEGVSPNPPTISDIKYELNSSAVLVPEATAKQITHVDATSHQLTLPLSAAKPEVGQTLIINTPTNELHDGLLAKVTDIRETESGYVVAYEDAELKDAFKTIEIPEQYIPLADYVEHIYDAEGKNVDFKVAPSTRASGHKNLVIPLPEAAWDIGNGLELTPKMSIDLMMRYVMMYGDYQIDYANMKVDADVTIGADVTAELTSGKLVEYRKTLLTIFCAGIPVGPVVITPGVEIAAVFKVDGKLSLELSLSYTRTVHANVLYQTGQGLSGDCNMDPEAPDALKFNFGPKFEGAVSYGLSAGPFLGIYGKTFSLNLEMDSYMKESVSGKLNLVEAFTSDNMVAADPINDSGITIMGTKWDFLKWDGLMFSQAFCLQPKLSATVMGIKSNDLKIPEISIPIDSRNVIPQVKVDEKDFFKQNDNEVTLTLHIPKKSLFDPDVAYRAVWTRVDAASGEQPVTAYFDFAAKRDMLENPPTEDIKKNGITTNAKGTLKKGENYNLAVYMDLLGMAIPIFRQSVETREIDYVEAYADLYVIDQLGRTEQRTFRHLFYRDYADFKTTMTGSKMHVDCIDKETPSMILSFDIDNVNAISSKTARIENIQFNAEETDKQMHDGNWYPTARETFSFSVPYLPMLLENWWELHEENGLKINNFNAKSKMWQYLRGWDDPETWEYNYTLVNDPLNDMVLKIKWK